MTDKPIAPQGEDQKSPEPQKKPDAAPTAHKKTSGMAVAGLVLGLIALLSCWIPLLNVITTPFAVLGIVFAIIGIVATAPSKPKGGRGIAIAGTVLCVISLVVPMAMYGTAASSSSSDKGSSSAIEQTESDDAVSKDDAKADDSDKADSSDAESADVKIVSCKPSKDYAGKKNVVVTYKWTNTTDSTEAFFTTYNARAYIDGEEAERTFGNGDGWYKDQKKVKKGKTQTIQMMYDWDGKPDVDVEVTDWIFSDNVVASKTFKF